MKNENEQNNVARVIGRVAVDPIKSHEIEGEGFYELILEVKRLSETYDYIPVTISERTLNGYSIEKGDNIAVLGEFRSYNKQENEKSKLILHLFVKELFLEKDFDKIEDIENTNCIRINGYLCKEPIYRVTPFKREICDALIAVNRRNFKSDYLPCIFWGRNARFMENQTTGTKISLEGRIQSRQYIKKFEDGSEEKRTAYEISVSKLKAMTLVEEEGYSKNEAYREYMSNYQSQEDVLEK